MIFLGGMLQGVWGKNGDDGGLYILYRTPTPKIMDAKGFMILYDL